MAYLSYYLVFLIYLCCVNGFNVDIDSCVKHRGPHENSMFGFTVAEHIDRGQKWILVGAPEDDTGRPGLNRTGAVYRCDINTPSACAEIIFDQNGSNTFVHNQQIEEKSHQWFGATLSSAGINGPVVACAPRYVSFGSKRKERDPVGTCFVARNSFHEINDFSPCRTSHAEYQGHATTGFCQAGFSAALSKDGRRLFLGAPGSWFWQGQIYAHKVDSKPVITMTRESSNKYDDNYMGYSIVAGDFLGNGDQAIAVGMPKGEYLRGIVMIYTWNLQNVKNITGSQFGAYFGYCLAAGDIDGDGLDDLIIGAPMYSEKNNEGSYETGRVYIVYQGRGRVPFEIVHKRSGRESRGRFGLSIASLGDMNLDGFGDFAVGAPYGGRNGHGVVYIYHGSKDGVREKASQVITAEIIDPMLKTFGFSLSGGMDLDGNKYTDMVVGAYESNTAVFLKARPVVKVQASVQFEGSQAKLISLDNKRCTLRNGDKVACTKINYCLQYDGINVDTKIEFDLFFNLDSLTKRHPRLYFIEEERSHTFNKTIILSRQQVYCGNADVYVINEPRDKLTPLEVEMIYNLRTNRFSSGGIQPVLDMNVGNSQRDAINIQKNCGPDNICVPNLKMSITPSVNSYLLGSSEKLGINVFVENVGEDAFETTYYLLMPRGCHFIKIERLETAKSKIPVLCTTLTNNPNGNNTLKCDIGNPLPANEMVNFKVLLQPYHIDGMPPSYEFDMTANSTNAEDILTVRDNSYHLSVGMFVDTNISLSGSSNPPELYYNATSYQTENITSESDMGPQVTHVYEIRNNGPSTIEQAEVFVLWPYQTLAGDDWFYVLLQPETSGNIQCETAAHINDRQVRVDHKAKSYLQTAIEGTKSKLIASNEAGAQASTASTYTQNGGLSSSSAYSSGRESVASSSSNKQSASFGSARGRQQNIQGVYGEQQQRTYSSNNNKAVTMDWSKPPPDDNPVVPKQTWSTAQGRSSGNSQYNQQQASRNQQHWKQQQSAGSVYQGSNRGQEFSRGYETLGREGEVGSSFRNRYGSQTETYGNYDAGGHGPHSWSTEETVNKDVMNAGSGTFIRGSSFSNAGTTYVDDAEEPEGFAAAAGEADNQFRTDSVDLGSLPSSRAQGQQSVNYQGGRVGYNAGSYQSGGQIYQEGSQRSYQSGSQVTRQSGSQQASGYGKQYGAGYKGGSYTEEGAYSKSYSSSSSGESARWRTRRQIDQNEADLEAVVKNCTNNFKCTLVRCVTGQIKNGQEVYIALRARINAKVLNEITSDQPVILSTVVGARVTRLPYVGKTNSTLETLEVRTMVTPLLSAQDSQSIPLWVIVLAACAGALLLALLIFALYKCGFFKRNRPSDSAERAPLNRQGYHDEQL